MRRRYLALLPVAIVCATGLPLLVAEPLTDETVVATVNGDAVKYGQIRIKEQTLRARFRRVNHGDPETDGGQEAMERDKRELETAKLAISIRDVVRQQQIARFGVDPTEQEIDERWKRWEREREAEGKRIDRDAMAREGRENLRQLLEALKEVMDEGQDADDVYERRLTGKMSREGWRLRLQYEGTPQKRKQLEGLLTLPDEELFDLHDGFRKILIMERTMEAVEKDLIRTDPEFAEYMRLARTDPSNERAQSKGPNYKLAKRHQWWQQRYREAEIEIKDERFKGALKELFK